MSKKESIDDFLNRMINESEVDLSRIISVGGQLVDLADPPPLTLEQQTLSDLWQKMLRGEITLRIPPPEGGFKMTEDERAMLVAVYGVEFDEDGTLILRGPEAVSEQNSKDELLPCKPGTKWEDISIFLLDEETIRIKTPDGEKRYTYHMLGMADKRAANRPRKTLWPLLVIFAENNGIISKENPTYLRDLTDYARLLNKHLQKVFGIKESIYVGHYKKEKAYKTKIKFYDRKYGA